MREEGTKPVSTNSQLALFPGSDAPSPSPEENAVHLLALADIRGVGFATVRALFDAFDGDLSRVWDTDGEDLFECLRRARIPQPSPVIEQIQKRRAALIRAGEDRVRFFQSRQVSILFRGTDSYPSSLYALSQPPAWLFVEGDASLLSKAAIVAVVGTRHPTAEGLDVAKHLSVLLVRYGCTILSGLAEGVDAMGHRVAVDYGVPTIAVLGHGIDEIFPATTADLRRQLVERGGAVVSEYLPADSYSSERFVARNRIQAGLSHAVGIVEGRLRSGTAHTVRFARQMRRPLFGVRCGAWQRTPNQELLADLEKHDAPVFELREAADRDHLRAFLHKTTGGTGGVEVQPRLFNGVVQDMQRLAREYDATGDDYHWLLEQVASYQRAKASPDAD